MCLGPSAVAVMKGKLQRRIQAEITISREAL
jgi:hypothetical protein